MGNLSLPAFWQVKGKMGKNFSPVESDDKTAISTGLGTCICQGCEVAAIFSFLEGDGSKALQLEGSVLKGVWFCLFLLWLAERAEIGKCWIRNECWMKSHNWILLEFCMYFGLDFDQCNNLMMLLQYCWLWLHLQWLQDGKQVAGYSPLSRTMCSVSNAATHKAVRWLPLWMEK